MSYLYQQGEPQLCCWYAVRDPEAKGVKGLLAIAVTGYHWRPSFNIRMELQHSHLLYDGCQCFWRIEDIENKYY